MSAVAFAMMIAVITVMIAVMIAVSPVPVIGFLAAATVIAAAARTYKAMLAPAVGIAPAGPGAHAEEDPVVEKSRPVKANRCAGVGRSFVA